MCLATAYKESDNTVLCRNISRIDIQEDKLIIRDIMGEEMVITGKLLMVDLANSVVKIQCD
jgi:predicted RNA-binding protein